jgi:hypothetical protein
MYLPHLLSAWYSSAGMVRILSVFMEVSFGFSRRPPFVGVYLFHSGFFSKRQDDSAIILEFWAKKIPPRGFRDSGREEFIRFGSKCSYIGIYYIV